MPMAHDGASTGPNSQDYPQQKDSAASGLVYKLARSCDDVVAAWRLVYRTYARTRLINPNPHHIHTAPQGVSGQNAIIYGTIGPLTVTTLTVFADCETRKLPLDRVYHGPLQKLRDEGRRLMEVGLFADRRRRVTRAGEALFHLMRFAFYFGLNKDISDFIIGIHPRHARFYMRIFGFEQMSDVVHYPVVNYHPVMLLRGDLDGKLNSRPLDPALQFFLEHPVASDFYRHRFSFDPSEVTGTAIEQFLASYQANEQLSPTG